MAAPILSSTSTASSSVNRASIACRHCRDRKTRCIGYPLCDFCTRNNLVCERRLTERPDSALDQWGQRILAAISDARDELLAASSQSPSSTETLQNDHDHYLLPPGRLTSPHSLPRRASSRLLNAEALWTWEIWQLNAIDTASPGLGRRALHHTPPDPPALSSQNAGLENAHMKGVRNVFAQKFLALYPVLDMAKLDRYMNVVAENGPGWNAESCLVLIVCALGASCSSDTSPIQSPPGTVHGVWRVNDAAGPARTYWTMAQRRLGFVIEDETLLSAQCFFFAGLWLMHVVQPSRARQWFLQGMRCAGSLVPKSDSLLASRDSDTAGRICCLCHDFALNISIELDIPATPPIRLYGLLFDPDGNEPRSPAPQTQDRLIEEAEFSLHAIRFQAVEYVEAGLDLSSPSKVAAVLDQLSVVMRRLHRWDVLVSNSMFQEGLSTRDQTCFSSEYYPSYLCRLPSDRAFAMVSCYREVVSLLYRPSLYLCLSPSLITAILSPREPPMSAGQQLLDRIISNANMCLRLSASNLQVSSVDQGTHTVEPSLSALQDAAALVYTAGCRHTELWLSHRSALVDCLLLLAASRGRQQAIEGDVRFSFCLNLNLPDGWHALVQRHVSRLLAHKDASDLWQCGNQLNSLLHSSASS